MASFGKVTAALLQGSQETTLAFANFNFDFTLIKYDAPEEYKGLGDSLSKRRKDAAEDGSSHIIARKLSALFQSAIPNVPNLIQAYGRRATEIAKLYVSPKDTVKEGIFAEHVGADGTTIWAAATSRSGGGAVTMHLLACILARIWTRTQAISIWSELIEQRKEDIRQKVGENAGPFEIADITASRIDISRNQLDEWDASARSWLQTADEAKKLQQTQLRLILDNVSLPVSTHTNVYTAVMEAWTSALLALENLITGTPQRIQDGAVLLGLSAWHLYPDMSVLGDRNQHIKQADPLISLGGIITLGLRSKGELDKGIYWSLPLAHVRYYGDPVVATRYAGIGESQVTFDEFIFVTLGSVLGGWNLFDMPMAVPLKLIQTLAEGVLHVRSARNGKAVDQHTHWLKSLASAAAQVERSQGTRRQQITRLISFGQRRCPDFLAPIGSQPPLLFGLTNFKALLATFDRDTERKITMLRNWALRELGDHQIQGAVIRYRDGDRDKFRYTSICRDQVCGRKRRRSFRDQEAEMEITHNLHWMDKEEELDFDDPSDLDDFDCDLADPTQPSKELFSLERGWNSWKGPKARTDHLPSGLEERTCSVPIPPGPGQEVMNYTFVYGDANTAAIFVPTRGRLTLKTLENEMSAKDMVLCIERGDVTESQLAARLLDPGHCQEFDVYFESLRAIHEAEQIYSQLPGARVDLQVTSLTLSSSKWWKACREDVRKSNARTLNHVFSCIALFETGFMDVDPAAIGEDVIAISNANSIFVACELLLDPTAAAPVVPVERITGNIGKPGFAFLITPPNPKVRKIDYKSWNIIAHEPFDGKFQDSFRSTSLHLSFTGYELPLDVGQRGTRDVPALFIETAVSVYDRGEWIADLDIMKCCRSWAKIRQKRPCAHSEDEKADMASFLPLVSVDSWLEFLDQPVGNSIVRAHANATARLATAALATQHSRKFLIMPEKRCWQCLRSNVDSVAARARAKHTEGGSDSGEIQAPDKPEDSGAAYHKDLRGADRTFFLPHFEVVVAGESASIALIY